MGLKPQAGANVKGKTTEFNITEEVSKKLAKRPVKKVKEIVGDGEEIEVEDSEDLSRNDIEAIYSRSYFFSFDYVFSEPDFERAQHNDLKMGEMEPSESFNLTLRGYQKQALLFVLLASMSNHQTLTLVGSWMHSLENGTNIAREATSMHPLWSE